MGMTKGELIEKMKNWPDDTKIAIRPAFWRGAFHEVSSVHRVEFSQVDSHEDRVDLSLEGEIVIVLEMWENSNPEWNGPYEEYTYGV